MSSAPDCASFRATHVGCGWRRGNYVMMCIYFVRIVYSTVYCVLTVYVRNDLGRPMFQSDSFMTHAFCTTVSSIMFQIRFMLLSSSDFYNVMMCIYFVGIVYSTVNCVLTVCVRKDLSRPKFQSDRFLTDAFSTAVSSIMFQIIV